MKDFKAFVMIENKKELEEFVKIAMEIKRDPVVGVQFVKSYPITVYWNCSPVNPKTLSGWDTGLKSNSTAPLVPFCVFKKRIETDDIKPSSNVEPSNDIEPLEDFMKKCYKERVGLLLKALTKHHEEGKDLPLEWIEEVKELSSKEQQLK